MSLNFMIGVYVVLSLLSGLSACIYLLGGPDWLAKFSQGSIALCCFLFFACITIRIIQQRKKKNKKEGGEDA